MNIGPAPGAVNLYVYFRIRADVAPDAAGEKIRAMQKALAERTGIAGRLMHRRDEGSTWMEVYEAIADVAVFETQLQNAVDESGLHDLIEPGSARHVERFVECA